MSLLKMVRHEPKSPLLEKGSVSLSPVRRRISWTTILTRQRLLAVVSMVLMLEVICTHQYKLSFSRLFQIALYRLTKGVNPLDSAILDVTRSREHTTILRPSIAYELHTLEASGVFGDWFGDPNEVGPSPFDYAIPPEWQRPLLGRRKWTVRTDTPCGPGVDDEICDLASALASTKYRQVKLADPMSGTNVARSRVRIETADTAGSIKLKIDLLNECAGSNCTSQLDLTHGGITVARHAFELIDFFEYNKLKTLYGSFKMQFFGHLSYAADPNRYYPHNDWKLKTTEVLDVDGILHKRGQQHPPSPEEYRRAKLCLFSREWIKAMLSGCVIVADMPSESEEVMAEAIVSYDASANNDEIRAVFEGALQNDMMLQKKALRAFIHARRWHTPAYQAGYILQLSEQHRAGERGYDVK